MAQKFKPGYADAKGAILCGFDGNIILAEGTTKPTDATAGYTTGCIFIKRSGAAGAQFYINEGSNTSCTFAALGTGVTLASETITTLTATTATITTGTITTGTITTLSDTIENAGVGVSTAAAGANVSNAGALPAGTAKVYPTTAADDTKGVVISASDQVTGRVLMIGNGVSNKILKVYGPSGAVINGGSADAAFSSASGKGVIIACLSGSGNTWLGW